jgi:hypothetical protein
MTLLKATTGVLLLLTGSRIAEATPPPPTAADVGRAIYLHGVLGSGEMLEGTRGADGLRTTGAQAACVNCHQRSGLGSTEGLTHIPPIAGRYLLRPHAHPTGKHDLPYVDGMRTDREPYTAETLARAIREGIDSEGRALSYLMPRFALSESDIAGLIEYLQTLGTPRMPGVTDGVLHFATVITPDADPVKRAGMLDVMRHYFAERNVRQMVPSRRLQPSDKTMYADTMYMVHRQWELHEWDLNGAPETWKGQLAERMARQPVFAILSGLGGNSWRPVHEFCEEIGVPCLFPNVEVPVESGDDFFNLYFSRGVLLEAALIADRILTQQAAQKPAVIAQVYRAGDSGEAAAAALTERLAANGVRVQNHALPNAPRRGDVAAAVQKAHGATLVLWLRPGDVAALGPAPGTLSAVYISGLLAGLEHAPLPPDWRTRTELAYPFDLPEKRRVRVDYPLGWFAIRHIPLVAEQVQVDTYLACGLLSEAISHMVDNFNRPYLIERLQTMMERRIVTGYYPRLTLATHQRFASKGGYLTHFAAASGPQLVADSEWLTP